VDNEHGFKPLKLILEVIHILAGLSTFERIHLKSYEIIVLQDFRFQHPLFGNLLQVIIISIFIFIF